uniref:Histone deacetylase n=1 Tax=Steinernema glaseri TaxID=37863 RepID=A0A1I7YLI0_9BILA
MDESVEEERLASSTFACDEEKALYGRVPEIHRGSTVPTLLRPYVDIRGCADCTDQLSGHLGHLGGLNLCAYCVGVVSCGRRESNVGAGFIELLQVVLDVTKQPLESVPCGAYLRTASLNLGLDLGAGLPDGLPLAAVGSHETHGLGRRDECVVCCAVDRPYIVVTGGPFTVLEDEAHGVALAIGRENRSKADDP